jgi:hypothetical protein
MNFVEEISNMLAKAHSEAAVKADAVPDEGETRNTIFITQKIAGLEEVLVRMAEKIDGLHRP